MPPIKSPFQKLDEHTQKEMVNLKLATELMNIHKALMAKMDELQNSLSKIKQGPQGVPGPEGKPGIGISGKDGKNGRDGRHGLDGRDGRPGRDGMHADPMAVIEALRNLPEEKRLTTKDISGLDQTIQAFQSQMRGKMGYVHGGGDTVAAGTGISITRNSDGTTTIASTSTGFTELAATETPNGSTTVFTFATATAQPSFIISDNVWLKATTKSGTVNWTWDAGLKQATLTVPPQDDIRGIV